MPLDVDAVFAMDAIEVLTKLVSNQPHGERGEIADDIIEFVDKMEQKYKNK